MEEEVIVPVDGSEVDTTTEATPEMNEEVEA